MAAGVKRIPMRVEEPANVDRKAWPITQGVPFADGDLERGAAVVKLALVRPCPTKYLILFTLEAFS